MHEAWMRLVAPPMAPAPAADPNWLAELQRHAVQGMAQFTAIHSAYLERQSRLWTSMLAGKPEAVAQAQPGDKRFEATAWTENPYFDYLKQSYLLASRYVEELVEAADLEPEAKARTRFAARQWVDAMCPANFPAMNPEALSQALETGGESIARGLGNLLGDLRRGRISQTDETAFEVGRNVAVTPGEVIYENELIQLIQYAPTTGEVAARPLVMIPPCINKFYILDLRPENSLVAYAVASGHTVFMVSWRNVGPELSHLTWDDYLEKGVLAALRIAKEIAKSDRVNALGFCIGGTLLGSALAVLAAKKKEELVASATFLTAMLDFSEAGQLGVYVDGPSVASREAAIGKGGILPGEELAQVFSSLRANDLVWPYVVRNYLLGERPRAFDLLYWNADGTNLPGPMFCYYLRNTYLENRLSKGALVNCGVPVDLAKIAVPVFVYSSREDHIVPWRAAYRTVGLVGGEKTFVLGASGHIAGVINPAGKVQRRSHWSSENLAGDADSWLEGATEHPGSWWPRWMEWLSRHGGGTRKAPKAAGNVQYKPIEPAPGRYVKQRIH